MRYFKIRLTRPDDDELLFETDFQVDRFDTFMRGVASVLVQHKLLREGERYDARIIPRAAGNTPDFVKPVVLAGAGIVDDGQGFLDILFEVEPPVDPVTYLTTQIRSKETHIVHRFDWQLDKLLGTLLTSIAQVLMDDGTLIDGDRFRVYLSAHDEGRPRLDPVVVVKEPATTAPAPSTVHDGLEPTVTPAPSMVPDREEITISLGETEPMVSEPATTGEVEIIVESVEELIKPEPKSMAAYPDVESVGQISEQDVVIFMRRGAMEQARKAAHVGAAAVEEVGGFLVGNVFRDSDSGRLFVEVGEVIEASEAQGTAASFDFDYNAWRQVLDRIDKEFPDKIPVGWYHTHLISLAVLLPVKDVENEYVVKYTPFFSQPDLFIHRSFFPDPWHVALVMDLRCQRDVFFGWREGEIMPTGFYLYGK